MNDLVTLRDPVADPAVLAARLRDESAPDIVEALNQQPPEVAASVLLGLGAERAVEVLDQPGLDEAVEIVEALPRDRAGPLLAGMAADRLADVF
ncbi:magnesium transporter MgtE N-terminal domain-containing protein, partial [Methylobacterium gnaphalii]